MYWPVREQAHSHRVSVVNAFTEFAAGPRQIAGQATLLQVDTAVIVPTLRVVTPPRTLRVHPSMTQSVSGHPHALQGNDHEPLWE